MNLSITPPDQILQELTAMDSFLNITCSEQIEEVVLRGSDLGTYMARSGKLLADAKHHLNTKMVSDVFDTLREIAKQAGATGKATNKIIDSLCAEEQYLVDWCERINKTTAHQLDWCRTLISKAKEEMRLAPQMYNNNRF